MCWLLIEACFFARLLFGMNPVLNGPGYQQPRRNLLADPTTRGGMVAAKKRTFLASMAPKIYRPFPQPPGFRSLFRATPAPYASRQLPTFLSLTSICIKTYAGASFFISTFLQYLSSCIPQDIKKHSVDARSVTPASQRNSLPTGNLLKKRLKAF